MKFPVRIGIARHIRKHIVLASIRKGTLQPGQNIVTVLKCRAARGSCNFGQSAARFAGIGIHDAEHRRH